MSGKEDAVLNELKFKVERLIKLYISSLQTIEDQKSRIEELSAEIENLKSEKWQMRFQVRVTAVIRRNCELTNWCGRSINVLLF